MWPVFIVITLTLGIHRRKINQIRHPIRLYVCVSQKITTKPLSYILHLARKHLMDVRNCVALKCLVQKKATKILVRRPTGLHFV